MDANQFRVMQIIRNLDIGGAQEVVRTLAVHLQAGGCPVLVVSFKDGPLRTEIERLGIPVAVLPNRRFSVLALPLFVLDLLRIRRELVQLVRTYKITVVQTHLLRVLDFLVLTLRYGTSAQLIFWTIHNYNFALRADQVPRHTWLLRPKRWAYRLLYRWAARWVAGFIAVSSEVQRAILEQIGPVQNKITVICNGVDVDRYQLAVDRAAIRRELGLPPQARLIAVVGTLKPQKGHRYLIEAAARVLPQFPDVHIICIGDGQLRPALQAQTATLGLAQRIHFVGNRSDVPALLAANDYFVLPSLWEGLPMALIEAMASGLPIIATEVSGTKQVMVHGTTGLLVPPGDVEHLRTALLRLLSDPDHAAAMGAAARKRVQAAFSARKQAEEHRALYRQAWQARHHRRQNVRSIFVRKPASSAQAAQGEQPSRITNQAGDHLRIAYIIGTYPSLTTTFIDREITTLRKSNVTIQVVAMRRPRGMLSREQQALQSGVRYLLPVAKLPLIWSHLYFAARRPLRYCGTLAYLLTRPHPSLKARAMTLLHFGEAVYAAHLLRSDPPQRLHAHFLDRAATVALVVSRLLDIPYSISAHANDIYVNPVLLPEKLGAADFVVTCTGYNRAHLNHVSSNDLHKKLHCLYHGLEIERYQPPAAPQPEPRMLLAVGQLKEKKGFRYLIQACHELRNRGYAFTCNIVGDGPLRTALQAQIDQLGLQQIVTLCGAQPHARVIDQYQRATAFVLPCVLSANGDRDGIPNVILEAMAMALPVVSTQHSGIPEVVQHGVNGLLVPPGDAAALANALATLLDDPRLRQRLGQCGRQTVIERFDAEQNVKWLLTRFRTAAKHAALVPGS